MPGVAPDTSPGLTLVGEAAGSSSANGTLTGTAQISGASAGSASVSGFLAGVVPVVGTTSGSSSASGTLDGAPSSGLVGWAQGTASASGILEAVGALVGTASGSSSASGTLLAGAAEIVPVEDVAPVVGASTATVSFSYPGPLPGIAGFRTWVDGEDNSLESPGASGSLSIPIIQRNRYTLVIAAEDGAGNLGELVQKSFDALPAYSVPVPTSVVATPGMNQASVSWSAPVGGLSSGQSIAAYEVRLGGITLGQVPATTLSYTMLGLMAGSPAVFDVAAVDNFGNKSAVVSASLVTPTGSGIFNMTAANFTTLTDALAKAYLRIAGDGATYGGGGGTSVPVGSDFGVSQALGQVSALTGGIGSDAVRFILAASDGARNNASTKAQTIALLGPVVAGLNSLCYAQNLTGIFDIPTLTQFYNVGAGGPWAALHSPEFGLLYQIVSGNPLDVRWSLYAPVQTLASRVFGSAMVVGSNINPALYAGAGLAQVVVTGWSGTSGVVTITGTARPAPGDPNADNPPVAARNFTATITGNGTFTLTPSTAGDLLMSVSAISLPAGMSGGTVTVNSAPPAGRSVVTA